MNPIDPAWLYQAIAEGNPDAFVFADLEGIIRLWSPGAERLFGYSATETSETSLDLVIPDKLRDRHWQGYRRVMATGTSGYGAKQLSVPALCKSEERLSIEFSMTLVRNGDGVLLGSGAIIRDVTERLQKEKALRDQLANLNRET